MNIEVVDTKEAKESEINQRIEAIRRRNEQIQRRYEEIENDKKNEETLSREALKQMQQRQSSSSSSGHQLSEDVETVRNMRESPRRRRVGAAMCEPSETSSQMLTDTATQSSPEALTLTYRPQRLSESDLPPEDPIYTYLTDRLREGAFCSPISAERRRRRSSATSLSDMSVGSSGSSSSGVQSRKVSTASNSSWSSEASQASRNSYDGFANYQPPTPQIRKYSATREYIKGRRISNASLTTGGESAEFNGQRNANANIPENPPQSTETTPDYDEFDWDFGKTSITDNDAKQLTTPTTPNGNRGTWNSERKTRGSRSKMVANWRSPQPTIESLSESIDHLVITTGNNNNDSFNNRNITNNIPQF